MADGSYRWQGHAPAPDAARVESIQAGYDEAEAHAFAEPARAAAAERIEAALAAARSGDLGEAADQLTRARSVLEGLDPDALEPRRGLAGLFDSRSKRLRAFRETFRRASAALSEAASDLTGRVEDAARRSGALDTVWADVRDAMVELDAHLIAAVRRLSGHAPADDAPPHPLEARKASLDACRAAALGALPLIRGAQNADARAAEALKACGDGVADWRQGWSEALGLAGKRPKKVRPDRDRLRALRDDLLGRIDRALAELTASRGRRAQIETRLSDLRSPL
ncbi:toxic anion resistance protein [Brevundimonas sp.]|uniref:toxic anion resistance protein n=1 Tax=Brevundimonas sp. TaxID=1871086 RepID=UPI0027EF4FF3|nr:toxic anion resistance protein [Brevundimonas sp.]MDQ7812018.1 toxic anion resistance protein [Brevundimonas sp.]